MKCNRCGRDNLTEADFYRWSRRGRDPFKEQPLMPHCKECHKAWVAENLASRKADGRLLSKRQPTQINENKRFDGVSLQALEKEFKEAQGRVRELERAFERERKRAKEYELACEQVRERGRELSTKLSLARKQVQMFERAFERALGRVLKGAVKRNLRRKIEKKNVPG